jgi:hypothetical protein
MMKLVSLTPYPFLHEQHANGFKIMAGAAVSASQIQLRFRIEAKTPALFSQINLPTIKSKPERKEELWKGTCFECFIPAEEGDAYLEFNGAPSGDWNWYSFKNYREGMMPTPVNPGLLPKQVSMSTSTKELDVNWVLPFSGLKQGFLAAGASHVSLGNLGLCVVLSTKIATTYWAIQHSGVKPDFHLRESFIYDSFRN